MVPGGTALAIGRLQGRHPSASAGGWAGESAAGGNCRVPAVIDAQALQRGTHPNTSTAAAIRFTHEETGWERVARLDVLSEECAIVRGEHTFAGPGSWRLQTHEMGSEVELGTLRAVRPASGDVLSGLHAGSSDATACAGGVAGGVETTILESSFAEPVIETAAGTSVTWVNRSAVPHQVAFEGRTFESSSLLKEGDRFSVTFDAAGEYVYHCAPHPHMTGVVRVP